MKKTILLLTFPNNMDQSQWIDQIQSNIVIYFGTKFAKADKDYPLVSVDCEVTSDDISFIKKNIDERVGITTIVVKESSENVIGRVIYLD